MPQDATNDLWITDQIYYVSPSKASRTPFEGIPSSPPYYRQCFLGFQNEIDRAFIQSLKAAATLPQISLQAYPYPTVTEDIFQKVASSAFPLLFVVCMIMSVKNIIKVIKRMYEFLRLITLYTYRTCPSKLRRH